MTYTRIGAVGFGVSAPQDTRDRAALAARPRLGDLLDTLEAARLESETDGSKIKVLSSDNATLVGQMCTGTPCQTIKSPRKWDGSNVLVWPAKDFNSLNTAWSVSTDYVGSKAAFALDMTNVAKAIIATRALIAAVDVKLAFKGLTSKKSSSSKFLPLILAGVGLVGLALLTRKGKGKRRKAGRRLRARRRR